MKTTKGILVCGKPVHNEFKPEETPLLPLGVNNDEYSEDEEVLLPPGVGRPEKTLEEEIRERPEHDPDEPLLPPALEDSQNGLRLSNPTKSDKKDFDNGYGKTVYI